MINSIAGRIVKDSLKNVMVGAVAGGVGGFLTGNALGTLRSAVVLASGLGTGNLAGNVGGVLTKKLARSAGCSEEMASTAGKTAFAALGAMANLLTISGVAGLFGVELSLRGASWFIMSSVGSTFAAAVVTLVALGALGAVLTAVGVLEKSSKEKTEVEVSTLG
ncbi:hypothetical protein N9Y92_01585 [Chlamydiales bacterium]|nr:hypothetical protein [Chlamydiales bacterium]